MRILSRSEYEEHIAQTRDARMDWWRKARFGMFVHFGLYSQLGRNEWVQTLENIPVDEYASSPIRSTPSRVRRASGRSLPRPQA